MPSVSFRSLMENARRGGYAVGYFESWNMESLAAVADAAEARRSPVILGFSGIYLPQPGRVVRDRLGWYYRLGRSVCDGLSVPACLLFNESPDRQWVDEAVALGFDLVMFSDEALAPEEQVRAVSEVVHRAHERGVAVEGELSPLPGAGSGLETYPGSGTDAGGGDEPEEAARFVALTGVDALAVSIGQAHLHGRRLVSLDLERLGRLRAAVEVALVLHGASSVAPGDLQEAIRAGVGKINVGSVLKRVFFDALMHAGARTGGGGLQAYNPYEVLGSGTAADVLAVARLAMQAKVEELMELFGSAGRAGEA